MRWLSLMSTLIAGAMLASGVAALECRDVIHDNNRYTVCEASPEQEQLRLFLKDDQGAVYGQFTTIEAAHGPLRFAMNAGMYHEDRTPVGHYVENGKQQMRVIPFAGSGNFGLLPNRVFCIGSGRADVFETKHFLREKPSCTHATQSGPMLVIDGALHPRFLPDSTSRYIRNGVGSSVDGRRVVFAISENTVTFHEFGRLFRDVLKLPQALYFDGSISRLHVPSLGRSDIGFRLGPIVGILAN